MEASDVVISPRRLVNYLKRNFDGPDVVAALRHRAILHWLYPEVDPLSNQILGSYKKISELVELPFNMLDVGCMSGFLKHYLDQRTEYPFRYIGIDKWPEAIEVAKEFFPHTEFHVKDILEDEIEGTFSYVCLTNIAFGKKAPDVVRKLAPLAEKALFIAMPQNCGDYLTTAKEYGECEVFDCGASTLIKVNIWP
jgi:SAM-dependent methyltransferase